MVAKSIAKMYTNIHKPTDYRRVSRRAILMRINLFLFLYFFHADHSCIYVGCSHGYQTNPLPMNSESRLEHSRCINKQTFNCFGHKKTPNIG